MDTTPPWHTYPSLTEERLRIVASLIAQVRHEVSILHEPSQGDNNWSFGCRAYARTCHALTKAVESYPEWLSVIEDTGLHFVFGVGGSPLRIYKGEPEKTPARSLKRNYPEIQAQQMSLFANQHPAGNHVLRIAIETDELGEASAITFVELEHEDGELISKWPIPLDASSVVTNIVVLKEGIVQGPAMVLPFKDQSKKKDDEIN